MVKSKSAYSIPTKLGKLDTHIFVVWVDNEAGVLARVVGLFSGRGYNIESLTVAEIDNLDSISRISIVTCATPMVKEQIKAQLGRLVPVHDVDDLSDNSIHVERELALVKIVNKGSDRIEALRIAQSFRAHTVDSTLNSFVFEVTGNSSKHPAYINKMKDKEEMLGKESR